jgi:hypothetical protein
MAGFVNIRRDVDDKFYRYRYAFLFLFTAVTLLSFRSIL